MLSRLGVLFLILFISIYAMPSINYMVAQKHENNAIEKIKKEYSDMNDQLLRNDTLITFMTPKEIEGKLNKIRENENIKKAMIKPLFIELGKKENEVFLKNLGNIKIDNQSDKWFFSKIGKDDMLSDYIEKYNDISLLEKGSATLAGNYWDLFSLFMLAFFTGISFTLLIVDQMALEKEGVISIFCYTFFIANTILITGYMLI